MSVIGLDVGTSRVKAVRFDEQWRAVDAEGETTLVVRGDGGRREQDMGQVWSAVARVLASLVARTPDTVELVAVTAQGDGCWLVDEQSRPVGPALLWNDNRAADLVERWQDDGTLERAFRVSGCFGAPGLAHAQLRWLEQHEPSRITRAARLLSCGSWIFSNLTGRHVLDESEAANPFCNADTGWYDAGLLDLFGLTSLAPLLPPIVTGADRVAPLTAEAANSVGLPSGTPVALAPYDVVATAVGTGVVTPGSAFAVLGTTLCVGTVSEDPLLDRPPNGMSLPAGEAGRWLIAYATMTGTEVVDWAAQLLGLEDVEHLAVLAQGSTRADVPLLLPYLSPAGERSPFLDHRARGSMLNLDVMHSPADVARATFDGLALAVLDCLTAAGLPASLALSGGGARSSLWCQMLCDATGVPVILPDTSEVGALGAALVGATAAGHFPGLEEAVTAVVRPGEILKPEESRTEWYQERYQLFLQTRARLLSGDGETSRQTDGV